MKIPTEGLLYSYYVLAAKNRLIDSEGDHTDAVILLHEELVKQGIEHKFPI